MLYQSTRKILVQQAKKTFPANTPYRSQQSTSSRRKTAKNMDDKEQTIRYGPTHNTYIVHINFKHMQIKRQCSRYSQS